MPEHRHPEHPHRAPGWYADSTTGQLRWWDGSAWAAGSEGDVRHGRARPLSRAVGRVRARVAPATATVEGDADRASDPDRDHRGGRFGGRRERDAELERLQGQLDAFGFTERIALQSQLTRLRSEVPGLAAERDALAGQVERLRGELARLRGQVEAARRPPAPVGELPAAGHPVGADITPMPVTGDQGPTRVGLAELKRQIMGAG